MDTKRPLLPNTQHEDINTEAEATRATRQKRKSRFQMAAFMILSAFFWLARSWSTEHKPVAEDTKVPLDVHIMSKCPDAQYCLKNLVVPAMSQIASKVSFRLSFIGNLTATDDGVRCKHGETECLGNIVMLCAASEYPDPKLYLGFANCMMSDYEEIPSRSLIQDCALEHGLSFETLNDCMSRDTGAYGMGLLRDSVKHTEDVGVATSCTVRLDEKVRCVRDGKEWKDCEGGSEPEDLVNDVKRLFDEAQR